MHTNKVKRTGNKKLNVFTSLFTSYMFIMLIPLSATIMVAALFQMVIASQVEKDRQNYSQNINNIIESAFTSASSLAYEISVDNKVVNYAKSSSRDFWTEHEILTYLKSCIGNYGDISTCYIYLPQYDCIISDSLGVSSQSFYKRFYSFGYEKWMEELGINIGKICIRHWPGSEAKINTYSLIMKAISLNTATEKPPVVVVQMNDNALLEKVLGVKSENNAKVLVYNDAGIILSTFEQKEGRAMYEKATADSSIEPIIMTIDNKTYQVIKNKTNKYNFTSLYAAPLKLTNANLTYARSLAVIATFFCVIVTIICCIVLSKRHSRKVKGILTLLNIDPKSENVRENSCFQPYKLEELTNGSIPNIAVIPRKETIINEYTAIESRVKEYINNYTALTESVNKGKDALQVMFLEKLLLGNIQDDKSIEKYMKQYNIRMTGKYYAVALYAMPESQVSSENSNDGSNVENLVKTILTEVLNRMLYSDESYYIMRFGNDIACILNFPERTFEQRSSDLDEIVEESVKILNKLQDFEYDGFLSRMHHGAAGLKDAYVEVLKNMSAHKSCQYVEAAVKMQPDWVLQCIGIIEQNYHDVNLSTSYIADKLNLARSYMSSSFKQYTGTGLHDKILEYRIMMARKMIQDYPDILILEVAKRTGFNNVASFIRTFKKLEGVTPGEMKVQLENIKNRTADIIQESSIQL